MQLIELRLGEPLQVFLGREYTTKGRRLRDIATDLGVDTGTVSRWMAHFGVQTRTRTLP